MADVERVPMEHPNLPEQIIHVRPAGVDARKRRGWKLVARATPPSRRRSDATVSTT